MKTQEELNALKEEIEALNKKLAELTDEELARVTGGLFTPGSRPVLEPDTPHTERQGVSIGETGVGSLSPLLLSLAGKSVIIEDVHIGRFFCVQ